MYISEFAHLNPLVPHQYFRLCKKVYAAFSQNDGKVRQSSTMIEVEYSTKSWQMRPKWCFVRRFLRRTYERLVLGASASLMAQ